MRTLPPTATASRLLDQLLADPGTRALDELIRWLIEATPIPTGLEVPRTARLMRLMDAIDAHPRADRLRIKLREVWCHPSGVRMLAETGLPGHGTLIKESLERILDRLVPRLEAANDLSVMVSRLPLTERDAVWVEALPQSVLAPWRPLLALPNAVLADAARLIAVRAAALGLTRALLALDEARTDGASPFLQLPAAVEACVAAPLDAAGRDRLTAVRASCDTTLAGAHRRLEERGVSTDILYQLELLDVLLARLDDLVLALSDAGDGRALACEVVRGTFRQRGIRSLARNTLKRLALKVTEHSAETGEHYMVRDAREWEETERSAAGGGLLTAGTALVKYAVVAAPFAPLVSGLASALNYSASFIAMQFAHFTLASKQPAMTGAALASALDGREDLGRQVEVVAAITRSQVAATIGNVFTAIPASVLIVVLFRWIGGVSVLPADVAIHSVHSVHPFLSLTIPFAILTGVFLWLSSLATGLAANWSAYRGLPEALAAHRGLRDAVGASGAARIGRLVEQHLSGVVGYLVLGMLLGFVPVLFDKFVGLPIEVRHVTLQAASLALAASSLYGTAGFHWGEIAWGGCGIVLIAACNLGVSFALALRTAMRARDLGPAERARLWAAIRIAFAADPRRFLWRPRGGGER
jgi:site-specific recombinase